MNDKYGVWNGEKIEFTLQKICDILEMEVPERHKEIKDDVIEVITYNDFFGSQNFDKTHSVIFDVWPSRNNEKKYAEYCREGVMIFSATEWNDEDGNPLPLIKVEKAIDAWYKIGKYVKDIFAFPTIGITGAVGKTTTTLFAENVFSEKFKVFVSGNNRNTAVEIIRQMILRYEPSFQIHIQEAGGGRSRLVEESAELLTADAFGITKISKHHHIDHYDGPEDILRDKMSFDRHAKEEAFGVINLDDEVLQEQTFQHRVITYGIENPDADYKAKDIKQEGAYLKFTVVHGEEEYPVKINIVGRHNVQNALMVIALAENFGMTKEEIQRGFLRYKSGAIRQSVREVSGRTMYIDCFNVCSDSIMSCVETLRQFDVPEGNRKIAVIGGENALGDQAYSVNYETGTKLKAYDIDEFIFVGPKEPATDEDYNHFGHGKAIFEGAETVLNGCKTMFTDDLFLLAEKLKKETKPGDVILFKGIFRVPLFAAIDIAFGTSYLVYNPNFVKPRMEENGFRGGYAKEIDGMNLMGGTIENGCLKLPDTIHDHPLYRIGKKVFANKKELKTVDFGKKLKTIGEMAFANCTAIEELVIPANVIHIEKNAFAGCTSLKKVVFEGVEHIEQGAFRGCKALEQIVFKRYSCKTIEANAFIGCGEFEIKSPVSYVTRRKNGQLRVNLKLRKLKRILLRIRGL